MQGHMEEQTELRKTRGRRGNPGPLAHLLARDMNVDYSHEFRGDGARDR